MLTLGSQGAALCTLESPYDDNSGIHVQHLSPMPANIVNTNGAGDCVVAGALACLVRGSVPLAALAYGMVSIHCNACVLGCVWTACARASGVVAG